MTFWKRQSCKNNRRWVIARGFTSKEEWVWGLYGILREEKDILCDTLMVNICHGEYMSHLSKFIEHTIPIVNPNVNYNVPY